MWMTRLYVTIIIIINKKKNKIFIGLSGYPSYLGYPGRFLFYYNNINII